MSLFFRNLAFTILQPGTVLGVVPYFLGGAAWKNITLQALTWSQYFGLLFFVLGFVILMVCIVQLTVYGNGTLSPADPTRNLVLEGLYKYSRNPMYIGVIMMLVGESFIVQVVFLWIYSGCVSIGFELFTVLREEPRLRRDFGTAYEKYCEQVRRWL